MVVIFYLYWHFTAAKVLARNSGFKTEIGSLTKVFGTFCFPFNGPIFMVDLKALILFFPHC